MLALGFVTPTVAWSYANPNPSPVQQPPPAQPPVYGPPYPCTPPNASNCSNPTWTKECTALYPPTNPNDATTNPCYGINLQSWNVNTQQLDSGQVFERVNDNFTTAQLVVTNPLPTKHLGGKGTWASQEDNAKWSSLSAVVVPGQEINYTRNIGSTAKYTSMTTCENYVYRSFYDVERWIDAMNACKGSARCIVNVSLNGMTAKGPATAPGIARREMQDSEGNSIKTRLNELVAAKKLQTAEADPFTPEYTLGTMPKNAFYANGYQFITKRLIDAFQSSGANVLLQDLENELYRGSTYYVTRNAPTTSGNAFVDSDGSAHRGFYDEWDFHHVLNKWTTPVTDGEFREYRRRNDGILSSFDLLTDDLKCVYANIIYGTCNGHTLPNAIGKVNPGDTQMWQNDPFAARSIFGSVDPSAFAAPPSLQGQIGFGGQLQPSAYSFAQLQSATTMLSGQAMIGSASHLPGLVQTPQMNAMQLSALSAQGAAPVKLGGLSTALSVGGGNGFSQLSSISSAGAGTTRAASGTGTGGISTQPPVMNIINIDGPAPFYDPTTKETIFTLSGVLDRMWEVNPPRIDTSVNYPRLDCRLPTRILGRDTTQPSRGAIAPLVVDTYLNSQTFWKDACDMINVYLDEWGRHLNSKPSCLDPKQFVCDWSPKDFVDRFVTEHVSYAASAKEVELRECKRWTGGTTTISTSDPNIGIPNGYNWWLGMTRGIFQDRENAFNVKMKNVPLKGKDDFGKEIKDSQTIGNSSFGGGFDYDLAWHVQLFRSKQDLRVCRSGGTVSAAFNAHATLFSNKSDIIDAYGMVTSNEGDSGTALGNSHLYVLGYELFDTKDADGAQANGDYDLSAGYDKFVMKGGRPELFTVPFQVGWVTITVSAGIAYDYGVVAGLSVGAPSKADCNPDSPALFKAKASFAPFADLGVWVDADVSLAGIAGVGVEVNLTLVGLSLPLNAELWLAAEAQPNNGLKLTLNFDCTLDLVLSTLKGELDFYIKAFWAKVASFTILKWDGFSHRFPVFRTPKVSFDLVELNSPICPPEQAAQCAL